MIEVAVLGLPDARWGEIVAAALVLKAGADTSVEALKAYLETRLADYKQVRRWRIVEALPRNGLGKVRKIDLLPGFQTTQA